MERQLSERRQPCRRINFDPYRWRTSEHRGRQTILQAARANGKYIPTLCYLEGLSAVGACRLCIVEVSGTDRLLPACTTPVQEGMSVTTNSEKLTRYRRMAIELLFSERNHICAVCVSNGHCELQAMAQDVGRHHRALPVQLSRGCRWTCRTSASCWTTTAASCVRAACVSARKWRARMSGMSSARGIHSQHHAAT